MKDAKRLLPVLLAFLLLVLFTACGQTASPEAGAQDGAGFSDGLDMVKLEDSYMVSGIGTCKDRDIVIPSSYDGLPVRAVGVNAFANAKIESVRIPGSVKRIGGSAFQGCSGLKKVVLGEGIETVGDYAFDGCGSLEEVTLPASLRSVAWGGFSECALKKVTFLGNTDVGGGAFADCGGLKEVLFGGSDGRAYSIGDDAFTGTAVESVAFSEGLERIGDGAFIAVESLKTLFLPLSVTSIDNDAFACTGLEQIRYAGNREQWNSIECVVGPYDVYENPLLALPVAFEYKYDTKG